MLDFYLNLVKSFFLSSSIILSASTGKCDYFRGHCDKMACYWVSCLVNKETMLQLYEGYCFRAFENLVAVWSGQKKVHKNIFFLLYFSWYWTKSPLDHSLLEVIHWAPQQHAQPMGWSSSCWLMRVAHGGLQIRSFY